MLLDLIGIAAAVSIACGAAFFLLPAAARRPAADDAASVPASEEWIA